MTASGEHEISFQFSVGRRQCLLAALPQLLMLPTLVLPVWWPYWPLSIVLGILLMWQLHRRISPVGKPCQSRITGLGWDGLGTFDLRLGDGSSLQADLLPGAIVHPRLLALRFRGEDGRIYRLIQPISSTSIQQLAALRRQLLSPGAEGGDHPSPSA